MPRIRLRFRSDTATTEHLLHLLLSVKGVGYVEQTEGEDILDVLPQRGNGRDHGPQDTWEARVFDVEVPDAATARRVWSVSEAIAVVTGAELALAGVEDEQVSPLESQRTH